MKKTIHLHLGFTLVEALLVVSMLSLVGLALFHTFINGLKIWERSRQFVVEEDVAIFFDKAGEDLRNAFVYSKIPFQGKETILNFPTRIKDLDPVRNRVTHKIGAAEYRFDVAKKTVIRRQRDYGEAVTNGPGTERTLVHGVQNLRFSYYVPEGNTFTQEPESDRLPSAVLIEVEFNDRRGKRFMKKMVNLQVNS